MEKQRLNKRQRRDVYLSTRRPAEYLADLAELRREQALPLKERYLLTRDRFLAAGEEIPERILAIARERGWE